MARAARVLIALLPCAGLAAWFWTIHDEPPFAGGDAHETSASPPAHVLSITSGEGGAIPDAPDRSPPRIAAAGPWLVRVQWPNGDPAAAEVDLTPLGARRGQVDVGKTVTRSTDPFGVLVIETLPEGTHLVVARAIAEEGAFAADAGRGGWWTVRAELAVPGAGDLVLSLAEQESVRGRVVDSIGKPIETLEVFVRPSEARDGLPDGRLPFSWEFASKDGRFELYGLFPGTWNVRIEAAQHWSSESATVDVPSEAEIEFVLERALVLRGRVVDAHGEPVNGCTVRVSWRAVDGRSVASRREARTFIDGSFEVESVPRTVVELDVRCEDVAARQWTIDLTQGEPRRDLVLEVVRSR